MTDDTTDRRPSEAETDDAVMEEAYGFLGRVLSEVQRAGGTGMTRAIHREAVALIRDRAAARALLNRAAHWIDCNCEVVDHRNHAKAGACDGCQLEADIVDHIAVRAALGDGS